MNVIFDLEENLTYWGPGKTYCVSHALNFYLAFGSHIISIPNPNRAMACVNR